MGNLLREPYLDAAPPSQVFGVSQHGAIEHDVVKGRHVYFKELARGNRAPTSGAIVGAIVFRVGARYRRVTSALQVEQQSLVIGSDECVVGFVSPSRDETENSIVGLSLVQIGPDGFIAEIMK